MWVLAEEELSRELDSQQQSVIVGGREESVREIKVLELILLVYCSLIHVLLLYSIPQQLRILNTLFNTDKTTLDIHWGVESSLSLGSWNWDTTIPDVNLIESHLSAHRHTSFVVPLVRNAYPPSLFLYSTIYRQGQTDKSKWRFSVNATTQLQCSKSSLIILNMYIIPFYSLVITISLRLVIRVVVWVLCLLSGLI